MAVDDGKRRVFLPQMQKNCDQRDVLDHIGEVPRVITVPVIHASNCPRGHALWRSQEKVNELLQLTTILSAQGWNAFQSPRLSDFGWALGAV